MCVVPLAVWLEWFLCQIPGQLGLLWESLKTDSHRMHSESLKLLLEDYPFTDKKTELNATFPSFSHLKIYNC